MKEIKEIWRKWKDGYESVMPTGGIRKVEPIFVSNYGHVRGRTVGKDGSGYLRIFYKGKGYFVHRIVGELFIPNLENKPCIDHINTVRTDNRVKNLRWVTYEENSNNPISKEHTRESNKENIKKANKASIKAHSKKVLCLESGIIYNSTYEAARILGIKNKCNVSNVANPNDHHKSINGLHFKYV